jgi:uncharacterized protein with GYD domain
LCRRTRDERVALPSKKQAQSREAAMRPVIEKLGGKLVFYAFCFGEYGSILITQFPDPTSAAAGPIAPSAAGTVRAVKPAAEIRTR